MRESSESDDSSARRHHQRLASARRVGRCSDSEEEEEVVRPARGRKRKRSLEQFCTDDESATDRESPTAVTRSKKKRLKHLESDDEIR